MADALTVSYPDFRQAESLAGESGTATAFVLPFWLECWFRHFGGDHSPALMAIHSKTGLAGIAPLMIRDHIARFMGHESVMDFQDMILADDDPEAFLVHLLTHLEARGIRRMELGAVRTDSRIPALLPRLCRKLGFEMETVPAGSLYEMALPETWEDYLAMLSAKQRHEVRRKMRRLEAAGRVDYSEVTEPGAAARFFPDFLTLFTASRPDKANFLTPVMQSYFQDLAAGLAAKNLFRMGCLRLDGNLVAACLGFEWHHTRYLYNNGYDPGSGHLSVGWISKALFIRSALENGVSAFSFLKGDERYKRHLGGLPIPLVRICVTLTR